MENFAVDLDKVLDDFELDEDENENSFHYDKLQLEFQREMASNGNRNLNNMAHQTAGLGAVGGWSEAVHDATMNIPFPVGARGPPDGHDAEMSETSKIHSLTDYGEDLSSGFLGKHNFSIQNKDEGIVNVFSLPNPNTRPLEQSPNVPYNTQNLTYESNESCAVTDSVKDSVLYCSLDVIPPDTGYSSTNSAHDVQHPDILDVNQASIEENDLGIGVPPRDVELRNRNEMGSGCEESHRLVYGDDSILEHPRESLLLPDLMTNNNVSNSCCIRENSSNLSGHAVEMSNPAIVTENSLNNFRHNEPEIVQESLSINRIPEVVNIHQSAEQIHGCWSDNLKINSTSDTEFVSSDNVSLVENFEESNLLSHEAHSLEPASLLSIRNLPDVSVNCNENVAHVLDSGSINNEEIIRYDPHFGQNISEEELDAELLELEEEQARLHGAYVNSAFSVEQSGACSLRNEPSEIKSISFSNTGNLSRSPDLIGGIELDKPHHQSIKDELCDADSSDEKISNVERVDRSSVNMALSNNIVDQAHAHDEYADDSYNCDRTCNTSLPQLVAINDHIRKNVEAEDDLSSESTGTDTVSSSSTTLTEGESFSPDHQNLQIGLQQSEATVTMSDSPSRETPGNLVTAVFDDNDSSVHNEHSHSLVGAEGGVSPSDSENMSSSIGMVAPFWIPDDEAPNCQECGIKFTVIRRRHHCRGCGRVLCAPCCHFKTPLPYMEYKEARVCNTCLQLISEVSGKEDDNLTGAPGRPNPNNPMEYCSRIPPQQQVGFGGNAPLPSVMVPIGVLKRENSGTGTSSKVNKQVIFSDGIRPGGDLTELGGQARPSSPFRKAVRNAKRVSPNLPGNVKRDDSSGARGTGTNTTVLPLKHILPLDACLIPIEGGLPPVIIQASSSGEYVFDYSPDANHLEEILRGDGPPVVFALRKNLHVLVKLVKLDCCVGVEVWNVATRGLCNVGQEELVVLLEVLPGETGPPAHLFAFFQTVYQQANKGNLVTELGHTIFTEPEGFLGSKDHGGFLYIRPSFQCLQKLILPPAPYIFAVLIQKWETPWAKVFPLRLMLRLGAEFRYYPCPLVSSRNRKPVYCEIGHTIMNLLVDFRNYAYTVPAVQGFVIHMEDKRTSLLIPKNRYEQIWKALNNSNDHVLALAANFSPQSDSHLVTVEDDDGHYSTQAINIHNKPRKVTGASFIVFNGALKSNSGLKAKSSIVEDGLMVQIPGEMMCKLRDSLHNMKDFDIPCGPSSASEPDELVCVRWVEDDRNYNVGIQSPIDDRQMDGIASVKIHSGTDYISNDHLIRWTEVFIIQGETSTSNNDINISRLAESLARACCIALTPHLELLYSCGSGPNRLGLRATMHSENVGYESGMRGSRLLPSCMKELDTELIPVIHRAAANITEEPIVLELIFHIMEQ